MLKRSRIAAASATALMFAGWIYSQPQSGSPAEQLQATIQRLQNEIKSLQSTLLQLKSARTSAEPTAAQPTTAGSRIQQARTAYNDGRRLEDQKLYRAAVEYFANAIQLDPMNDAAYLHRAYCYHQLGDENAAVADFTQSLEVQPNNSRAYLGRATANAAMGKRAEALDDADEALRRDANSFEAFLLRGRLYQQQGDSERALADFASAQALSPKSEQPYLSRAETNLRDGKTDDAVADCDAADIDLAVAAVVVYHFAPAALPAGFLGVDVFFVVSGFLITRLLAAEVRSSDGIRLRAFWGRRIRRLLPALAVLVVVTVEIGRAHV